MEFEQFWSLYLRKESKADARKAYSKLKPEDRTKIAQCLPVHINRWMILQTEKHYIPLPATWIRGERWEDEIELPQPKLNTPDNVIQFARSKGIEARPGESLEEFTQRVRMTR